jgi:hypothetical protein
MVFTFVACSSDDHPPVPIAQRFPTAADAPGSKADPVEKRETTVKFDEFIAGLNETAINPDEAEVAKAFPEAGFTAAGKDTRFFGATHSRTAPHLFSSFIELDAADGAKRALDWIEADSRKPCPNSCATRTSSFDVDGIPDARGTHRLATAADIEAAGTENERPSDSYWVGFTDGSIVYSVELQGLPGAVSEEQAQRIARAYHDRLTGG